MADSHRVAHNLGGNRMDGGGGRAGRRMTGWW